MGNYHSILKSGTKIIVLLFLSLIQFNNIQAQEKKEINAEGVKKLLDKEQNWVVLDVRTPGEFAQGKVPGAVNIDIYEEDAFKKISTLNKDAKYIVYCRTRNRSDAVADFMIQKGFKTVYQMTDGIVGWNRLVEN